MPRVLICQAKHPSRVAGARVGPARQAGAVRRQTAATAAAAAIDACRERAQKFDARFVPCSCFCFFLSLSLVHFPLHFPTITVACLCATNKEGGRDEPHALDAAVLFDPRRSYSTPRRTGGGRKPRARSPDSFAKSPRSSQDKTLVRCVDDTCTQARFWGMGERERGWC